MRLDQIASKAWDRVELLAETDARIHDGAVNEAEQSARADTYVVDLLFGNFPQALPAAGADIMEIGGGLGRIMEAMNCHLGSNRRQPRRIIDLDIAKNMIAKAKIRLGAELPYEFLAYDGINVPLNDRSLDLIYSVACLQHIPRPFVFNIFFEIKRLLRLGGFAVFHLMSTDALFVQEQNHPWRNEISNQIEGNEAHWHHFYTEKEINDVLSITGFPYFAVRDDGGGTLVACVSTSSLELPLDFDPETYLLLHDDLVKANADPIKHYLEYGHKEARKWYRGQRYQSSR